MTKAELKEILIEDYHFDKAELKGLSKAELLERYEEVSDTSDMHPNESYDEFMEHEDY